VYKVFEEISSENSNFSEVSDVIMARRSTGLLNVDNAVADIVAQRDSENEHYQKQFGALMVKPTHYYLCNSHRQFPTPPFIHTIPALFSLGELQLGLQPRYFFTAYKNLLKRPNLLHVIRIIAVPNSGKLRILLMGGIPLALPQVLLMFLVWHRQSSHERKINQTTRENHNQENRRVFIYLKDDWKGVTMMTFAHI
jgi:hypothetical protein